MIYALIVENTCNKSTKDQKKMKEKNNQDTEVKNKPMVDRTLEFHHPDTEVLVTLEDGYTMRFFIAGLTDEGYISNTRTIRELES